ncbi:MAG: SpoIIE family protein phosphatase [Verrucomicrobiota bacterium]|nr:SpoIIE family protein phosphatase [Verrucomicrobiota bacterium]
MAHHSSGSLVWRILATALSLVVAPLLLEIFFLYLSIPNTVNKRFYALHFITIFLIVALASALLTFITMRRVARPLRALQQTMERVSKGALHVRYSPDKVGFEINFLGNQLNEMLDQIIHYQKEIEKERTIRSHLAEELATGHKLQISLLPKKLPQYPGIELFARFIPAFEVGGDFYDLVPTREGKLFMVIADAAGKGVSPCLYSLGLRSMLKALAHSGRTLPEIIEEASALFWQDAREETMFITLWAALYDPTTRELSYCSQGHPPTLFLQEGALKQLATAGIPLGVEPISQVETKTLLLPPNALLFLHTDGLIESHNREQQLFGMPRLEKILLQHAHLSARGIEQKLLEELSLFCQKAPQHDDLTFIVIRIS